MIGYKGSGILWAFTSWLLEVAAVEAGKAGWKWLAQRRAALEQVVNSFCSNEYSFGEGHICYSI